MRITYDPEVNAAYIRLSEKQGNVRSMRISDTCSVDIDSRGTVCGIELLDADTQLTGADGGAILFENVFTGERGRLEVG